MDSFDHPRFDDIAPLWFWNIIDAANGDKSALEQSLARMTREQLVAFAAWFGEAALELSDPCYVRYLEHASEDDVDDLARWIVSQGSVEYQSILSDPESIPSGLPLDYEASDLSWVAENYFYSRYNESISQSEVNTFLP